MAKQTLFLGTNPEDSTGTKLRPGGDIINDNFTELYNLVDHPTEFVFAGGEFRIRVITGDICIDQTLTPTGFAGTKDIDWTQNIKFGRP